LLIYVYPKHQTGSFNIISRQHIRYLRELYNCSIAEVDENVLDHIYWTGGKRILLHPIGYALIGDKREMIQERKKRLDKLMEVKEKLGGFDTADTDRLSDIAIKVFNKMDLIVVPSTWAKESYLRSKVKTNVEVLPHGIPESFTKSKKLEEPALKHLAKLKEERNVVLVLFFLMHSGFRKGADIVARAMLDVQHELKDVLLVVKRTDLEDPYLKILRSLKMIEIAGFLPEDQLYQLYKLCDLVIVPSRGGGFELNALEGIVAGVPTIVPNAGCFLDYINYAIPIRVEGKVRIFEYNTVHVGKGFEPSWIDLRDKIIDCIKNLEYYKKVFRRRRNRVLKLYSWKRIVGKLYNMLRSYGFIS